MLVIVLLVVSLLVPMLLLSLLAFIMINRPRARHAVAPDNGLGEPSFEFVELEIRIRRGQVFNSEKFPTQVKFQIKTQISNSTSST